MKQRRPRIKKARKEPTRERKPRNPMQITIPWGRGASLYRPGIFIKHYFEEYGESCCADIHHALGEAIELLNAARIEEGNKPLRRPTYSSFSKYFSWFKLLGLVEPVDRREPAVYDFLEQRQFYRLTDQGKTEVRAWEDPVRAAHPEFG